MPLATYYDACKEFATNVGRDNLNQEWILSPFDTWERNPFYVGPRGRHPEDDTDDFYSTTELDADDVLPF